MKALISVSDKTGIVELAQQLHALGVGLISTGGTAKLLADQGLPVTEVAEVTGFPEMLDGRVKTLHPKVHGGLLARREVPEHMAALKAHNIDTIDLLIVNLYPFEATVAKPGCTLADAIENIDIGGPAMVRSAAKNWKDVGIATDASQYPAVIEELKAHGKLSDKLRFALSVAAFNRISQYDGAISNYLSSVNFEAEKLSEDYVPERAQFSGQFNEQYVKVQDLRYGENSHQQAAWYRDLAPAAGSLATGVQLQGKELSYNNYNDTDAAFEAVAEFAEPACVVVKHANPCGVARGATPREAYLRALACDPVSAFGGIVALNRPLDAGTAAEIAKLFVEVIVAPEATAEAQAIIAAKKNLRLLVTGGVPDPAAGGLSVRTLAGGYLVQDRDAGRVARADLKVVTKRAPDARELDDLLFAFAVAKHVKSNAIVYARDGATVGIGAGQMSRIDSSRIAAWKAAEGATAAGEARSRAIGSVVASDAFFPFADGLVAAAEAGVTAVIQPGGSIRDAEVIAAADARGLAMVFTGMRHFRH